MELFDLINRNLDFLKEYHNFFKNNNITNSYYIRIKEYLSNEIFNLKDSKKFISEIKEIGVTHSSDLLTYYYVSRLMYSVNDLRKDSLNNKEELKNEILDVYFKLINFLLLSNIFPPNDKIDRSDIGNGKYTNLNKQFRATITKNLLPSILKNLNDDEFKLFIKKYFSIKKLKELCKSITKNRWNDIFQEQSFNKDAIIRLIEKKPDRYFNSLSLEYFCKNDSPSFLLKNVGLATELFVYLTLISLEYGFIVPLLLHQRLYSSLNKIFSKSLSSSDFKELNELVVTDFLLISKGRIYALELGRGKPDLISSFASITGIPTIFIDAHLNLGPKLGYKCNLCFNSFTICNKFIKEFKKGNTNFEPSCLDCEFLNSCKDKSYKFQWHNNDNFIGHIHKECYDNLDDFKKSRLKINIDDLKPTYAKVKNLEVLKMGL